MKNDFETNIELEVKLKGTPVELYRFMIDISFAIQEIQNTEEIANKEDRITGLNTFKEQIKNLIESKGIDLNELASYNYLLLKQNV
ncbi:hypothetical protein GRF59_15095 [Paenibacillus sp. HJL G12]|uniref:Uncharacterized protein n=1 Tax=Paenibacillus dendrobii TaxID=2691084 RepID=A0A7X3LHA6_9BACL|nr:hypothetical protein [Paenibacillus dendrobii]MWV44947.1 hypothetical protein [Paenibacillus dendrobii]